MRVTIRDLAKMKSRGEKIAMITAYDYMSAALLEEAGVPIVLVGDSLGQVVLGYDSTIPVTMDDMLHHIRPVVKGTKHAHVVGDMPFLSYQADADEAVRNAGRMLKEGGCQSIKLEGGRQVEVTVDRIVNAGIPVMAHIGLTPQAVNQLGGYRVQGRSSKAAADLIEDAKALEEAGAYAVVLELVPAPLAAIITERVSIPTIGIGAGAYCDGQVQVFHDLFGLAIDFTPKHARPYTRLADSIKSATVEYLADVRNGTFPTDKESVGMKESILTEIASYSDNRS